MSKISINQYSAFRLENLLLLLSQLELEYLVQKSVPEEEKTVLIEEIEKVLEVVKYHN